MKKTVTDMDKSHRDVLDYYDNGEHRPVPGPPSRGLLAYTACEVSDASGAPGSAARRTEGWALGTRRRGTAPPAPRFERHHP